MFQRLIFFFIETVIQFGQSATYCQNIVSKFFIHFIKITIFSSLYIKQNYDSSKIEIDTENLNLFIVNRKCETIL